MRVSERQLHLLAESVVRALLEQSLMHLIAERERVVGRVYSLLLENFRTEQELEEEAEKLARQHAHRMVGMDQRRIVEGIKERLARERGFTL